MPVLDCVFCAIARGELPCYRVFEDDNVVAFLDIHPVTAGHTLVVPKVHMATLFDLSDDLAGPLLKAVRDMARAVRRAYGASGINILQANGQAAGQTVHHLHVHVVARHEGDGLRLHIPSGPEAADREAMAAEARRIAAALA